VPGRRGCCGSIAAHLLRLYRTGSALPLVRPKALRAEPHPGPGYVRRPLLRGKCPRSAGLRLPPFSSKHGRFGRPATTRNVEHNFIF
jgi:hypothetical protein